MSVRTEEQLNEIVENLVEKVEHVAEAITPRGPVPGTDACGGKVDSLTEAVMGITGGLVEVADSIRELAAAVRGDSPTFPGEDS